MDESRKRCQDSFPRSTLVQDAGHAGKRVLTPFCRTIIPDAVAEPPSERSVFGEPARPGGDSCKNIVKTGVCKVGLGSGAGRVV